VVWGWRLRGGLEGWGGGGVGGGESVAVGGRGRGIEFRWLGLRGATKGGEEIYSVWCYCVTGGVGYRLRKGRQRLKKSEVSRVWA